MARLFISAAHKSSGKTTVTIGLAAALTARGVTVQTFKKGPDYIDPMWLAHASGRPCYNLDFNTQSHDAIAAMVASRSFGAELALIEGNKGLHDGVDVEGSDCSAALAKVTQSPVVLVLDVLGMTRGIAPLLLGYQAFDPAVQIVGVILNKVGPSRQESKLRQAIEHYTDIAVLGALPRDNALVVSERHLGLMTPTEAPKAQAAIDAMRQTVERGVDLERLLAVANTAPAFSQEETASSRYSASGRDEKIDIRIAVARDAAFGFYYADDLEAFKRAGVELVFFDALTDSRLPNVDGLFIGGGFPETQAARLSENAALRSDIAAKLRGGLPAYAECGGLMYLCRSIRWGDESHDMVGVVPADAIMHARPQGRGLVALKETADFPWPQVDNTSLTTIPAHEFHYAALANVEPGLHFAFQMVRGAGIGDGHDGIVLHNLLAGFSHLRMCTGNPWVERFAAFVRAKKQRKITA